jgi:pyruvate-formate lyase-activating enzyme
MLDNYTDDMFRILNVMAQNSHVGLVLYGIGRNAHKLVKRLTEHGVRPLCVCDGDHSLWHTLFDGLEILPIDEVKSRFGDFMLFISAENRLYEIIGYLLEEGSVSKDKIINYLPVSKRRSCRFLENHCIVAGGMLSFCYSDFDRNNPIGVKFTGNYNETVGEFIALRQQILHDISENISNQCSNCQGLASNYYPTESSDSPLKAFTYQNGGICNFRCSYCVARKTTSVKMELPELFAALKARGLFAPNFSCSFVAGEITIHPRRKKIYEALQMCDNCHIYTNALIYDEYISTLLSSGRGRMIVSIDAGTRDTFAKVKGVDAFDRVCKTLSRYGRESKNAIDLKYIFLPGINDNEADVDGFIALASEIKSTSITISSDLFKTHLINKHTVSMAEYLWEKVKDMSILCNINSYALIEKMDIPNNVLLLH